MYVLCLIGDLVEIVSTVPDLINKISTQSFLLLVVTARYPTWARFMHANAHVYGH